MGRIADFLKKHGLTAPENAEGFDTELSTLDSELEKPAPKADPPKTETKTDPPAKADPAKEGGTDMSVLIRNAMQEALKPFDDRMTALETTTKTQQEQTRAQEIGTILNDAVLKGKIEPDKKGEYEEDLKSAFDVTKKHIDRMAENPLLAKQAAGKQTPPNSGKTDDKGGQGKSYTTSFARGTRRELMEHVEKDMNGTA